MPSGHRTLSRRFFSNTPLDSRDAETTWLEGDEAMHLIKVLRGQVGDEVVLFDGGGAEHVARIVRRERNRVELALVERREVNRELPFELHLGVALPKGDRQKWLVEKAVELGVSSITPLMTQRSVTATSSGAVERLRRGVIEASKQSGRNRLLEIHPARDWAAFCGEPPPGTLRLIAHPTNSGLPSLDARAIAAQPPVDVVVAVGPEGGFSAEELEVARESGWQVISLGSRILRVESACLALAAWLAICWDHK
jgi:16S rRNA (uracil1498-N3)-methyltransferase